ncbi:pilus (MSHA type) biogenesis protein MshL [Vibrio sp. ABG19]|uniref:pilus (MSHA type) biogenesis protein MshL n=1 Tax=Vibrio sp. ABG19 TaxID=2817385 RepID=UPI00249DF091|nr:pilus (MSHA type) biogenesis protein MshL [Vibrio sp. ABG19]WGY48568.1 pilus (MSHA type) biogenesis protein MshL [Vibrio sp. ABG19]
MRKVVIGVMIAALMGCSMGHRDPVEVKKSLDQSIQDSNSRNLEQLPASVEADLMPDLHETESGAVRNLKRFRIQAKEVDAKAFFASLVQNTGYSVAIHPAVEGNITVNLSDVTLDEALDVVRNLYGYDIETQGKVVQVYPAGLRTVTIPVDYLQFKRSGRSLTSITTGTITNTDSSNNSSNGRRSVNSNSSSSSDSNGSNRESSVSAETARGGTEIETTSESDFWPQLETAVGRLIGSGRGQNVVVTPQAGVITLRAYPDEIREVRRFLDVSQQRMQRQVVLEAKILEVTLTDSYQQGINWSNMSLGNGDVVINRVGSGSSTLPGLDAIGTLLGGQTNITISDGSFTSVLNFMATQGDLNVLSSPRVTAANNQKAVIKVGSDEYYVTDLTSVVGSGDNTQAAPNVELTPFFSGISLDVTPQIDDKGNVLLHVHPSVIEVEQQDKEITYNDSTFTLPLARSSIRESDSVIRAQDGDVVVIGGLMKTDTSNSVSKVPFLGDIPALGHLFRSTTQTKEKTELVILLKPTVVGVNTWHKELERSRDLLQEWFPDAE